jgi:hypothetical protein
MLVTVGVEAQHTKQKERPRFTQAFLLLLSCVLEIFDFSVTGNLKAKRFLFFTYLFSLSYLFLNYFYFVKVYNIIETNKYLFNSSHCLWKIIHLVCLNFQNLSLFEKN